MTPDPQKPSLMVIAGEVSGDMHAGRLVAALRKRVPDLDVFGIGGDQLAAAGARLHYHVRDTGVMGLDEVLKRLPFFRKVMREMVDLARTRRPDAVLLVDYPGFNLRFARQVHGMGIRTVYYICPQVWAWHRSRIPKMARIIDRLITIFPFEKAHFEGTGLAVDFVGHPLVDEAETALAEPLAKLPWKGEPQIALLPGSRHHEVTRILPAMWQAAALLDHLFPNASFIVAAPSQEIETVVRDTIGKTPEGPARWAVVTGRTRQVLRQARGAMVASGTATLETALMRCPMIVVYRVAWLTYFLGRLLVRVPDIGMVNIVAGRRICPEFVQRDANPADMAKALANVLTDTPERAAMLAGLKDVTASLGPAHSVERAADIVAEVIMVQR